MGGKAMTGLKAPAVAQMPQDYSLHWHPIGKICAAIAGNESSIRRSEKTQDEDSAQYRIHLARCDPMATVPCHMPKNRIFTKVPARIREIQRQNSSKSGEKKAGSVPFWALHGLGLPTCRRSNPIHGVIPAEAGIHVRGAPHPSNAGMTFRMDSGLRRNDTTVD
ncbi:hypothetical protein N8D56_02605 [Devosia sp. A8/3-2]|nr:hypothetical protein N8D56_02605 [Devosia sp. A8/3-2]